MAASMMARPEEGAQKSASSEEASRTEELYCCVEKEKEKLQQKHAQVATKLHTKV
jgi:hypothetical protein